MTAYHGQAYDTGMEHKQANTHEEETRMKVIISAESKKLITLDKMDTAKRIIASM